MRVARAEPAAAADGHDGEESRGLDFYNSDRSLKALLGLYLSSAERAHLEPHLARLGRLIGDHLDDLARDADRTPPRLEPRTRRGEDRQSIAKSPAYVDLEQLAFGAFALACSRIVRRSAGTGPCRR